MIPQGTPESTLPVDGFAGALAGRVHLPDAGGPAVVAVRADGVFDISASFPTMSALAEAENPAAALRAAAGTRIGDLAEILANTPTETRDPTKPFLLAPIDLQVIKAAGVTFAVSALERMIEERARGDVSAAGGIRAEILGLVGGNLDNLKPGSPESAELKELLIAEGAWSPYLEVAIGPDAEIFTKAPVLAAVGPLADCGLHPKSRWNNSEPELVLIVSSKGRFVGASLGNDINMRDIEGRSALLLMMAKDNNASCSVGPFIRFFDDTFGPDDVRSADVRLQVTGEDGFALDHRSSLTHISRSPEELIGSTINANHRYPDGFVVFTGTMFAAIQDRDAPGRGFTHHVGDIVTVGSPKLGALTNRIKLSPDCPPWAFGIGDLMTNLAVRGLLSRKAPDRP